MIILDGVGINTTLPAENPFCQESFPHFESVFAQMTTRLEASGRAVGIPDGQIGNSEVGHMAIGSGRIIRQSIVKVDDMLDDGSFMKTVAYTQGLELVLSRKSTLHLMALFGPGGVHASSEHLVKILKILPKDISVSLHLFGDGRDIEPKSMLELYRSFEKELLSHFPNVCVSSLSGRYFAMDRDTNWERVQSAYESIVYGNNQTRLSVTDYIAQEYSAGKTDEFLTPVFFERGKKIEEGDAVFFLNFRSDRAKQLTKAFVERDFDGFKRIEFQNLYFATMTKYYKEYEGPYFIEDEYLKNVMGEVLEQAGARQLHIAETEKFAHVTKFFNGGRNTAFEGETDILIPSHKVATYDLDPEMSADEIFAAFETQIENFDFCVINFANGDMVGHTGSMPAVIATLKKLDEILGKLIKIAADHDIHLLIFADHGNCEEMGTPEAPKTAHTLNLVPFWHIYAGKVIPTKAQGGLSHIAPTALEIMGIEIPPEMDKSLVLR